MEQASHRGASEEIPNSNTEPVTSEPIALLMGQLVQAGNLCLDKYLLVPGMILMFSTIDILSGLDVDFSQERSTRTRFEKWVDRFVLNGAELGVTATDLYGARCGLIHEFSSSSDLVETGRATQIYYALHEPEAAELRQALNGAGIKALVLNVELFAQAMTSANCAFINSLEAEPRRLRWALKQIGGQLVVLRRESGRLFRYPRDADDLRCIHEGLSGGSADSRGN